MASLVPTPVAIAKVVSFLFWSSGAVTVGTFLAVLIAIRRGALDMVTTDASGNEEVASKRRATGLLGLLLSLVITAPPSIVFFDSWRKWALYGAYVALTCAGGIWAGRLWPRSRSSDPESLLTSSPVTYIPVYLLAILAGVLLAGTQNPALPLVEFGTEERAKGHLLSHTGGYWFVFDPEDNLSAIPDDEVGKVQFLREEPLKRHFGLD